jgi:signal transduction histidine kinase/CheY-like chemotaxis protein
VDIATDITITQRIRDTRLRMLMRHVSLSCAAAASFILLSVWLLARISQAPLKPVVWVWLLASLSILLLRTIHTRAYFQEPQPDAMHGYPSFLGLLVLNALVWVAAPWVLHVPGHPELSVTIIGGLVGIAAIGVLMLNVEFRSSEIWAVSILTSASAYCGLMLGGAIGWFSAVSIMAFLGVLLLEAQHTDTRIGEMLWLRFSSEKIVRDRDEALAKAELLSATKSRFLANMSHEIRTPIHCVLGLARMLEKQALDAEGTHQLKLLDHAGQHLLGLINDVLDFSRLQENRMELHMQAVCLPTFLKDTCDLVRINAEEKGLPIHADIDLPEDCWVQIDPNRLRQILLNLLSNSIKFTDQGHVTLVCRVANEPVDTDASPVSAMRIYFEVRDTGVGIPPNELDKIFNAFHQVEDHLQHRKPGTGLGLSIARALCRAMQGDIVCDSELGKGTRFIFTLPLTLVQLEAYPALHAEPSPEQHPPTDLVPSAFNGHVLLVEDNPVITMVTVAELESFGLQVSSVENGRDAVEWVKKHMPDLILMDCHMPVLNGFDASQAIRAWESVHRHKTTPIVAMTASSEVEDRALSQRSGMDDYLVKPFSRHVLARVLSKHLLAANLNPNRNTRIHLNGNTEPEQAALKVS